MLAMHVFEWHEKVLWARSSSQIASVAQPKPPSLGFRHLQRGCLRRTLVKRRLLDAPCSICSRDGVGLGGWQKIARPVVEPRASGVVELSFGMPSGGAASEAPGRRLPGAHGRGRYRYRRSKALIAKAARLAPNGSVFSTRMTRAARAIARPRAVRPQTRFSRSRQRTG